VLVDEIQPGKRFLSAATPLTGSIRKTLRLASPRNVRSYPQGALGGPRMPARHLLPTLAV